MRPLVGGRNLVARLKHRCLAGAVGSDQRVDRAAADVQRRGCLTAVNPRKSFVTLSAEASSRRMSPSAQSLISKSGHIWPFTDTQAGRSRAARPRVGGRATLRCSQVTCAARAGQPPSASGRNTSSPASLATTLVRSHSPVDSFGRLDLRQCDAVDHAAVRTAGSRPG